MLFAYDWHLALLCMIFPPISYICAEKMKKPVQRAGAAYKKAAAAMSAATLDRAKNAVTYRVYGCEDVREARYEKALTDYRRRHLGYIFQMYNLIPNLNIKENVETGAYLSDHPLDVDDILKTLGLYEHRHKLPSQLSGGQQQRCSIGRAIVKNPDILLCDEPTGALDYNTSKEILKLIETVNQKYSTTIIMVTHNEAIKDMADKVVKLRDGMIRRVIENDRKLTADELDW